MCQFCGKAEAGFPFYEEAPACTGCYKVFKRMHKHEKRAIELGLDWTHFTPEEIFERDGNICWICFLPVDVNASYESDRRGYATIDHVIALQSDHRFLPGHVPTNAQLAHFSCNSGKGKRQQLNTTVYCCTGMYKRNEHSPRCNAKDQSTLTIQRTGSSLSDYVPFEVTVEKVHVSGITPDIAIYDCDYVTKDSDGLGSYSYYEVTFSDGHKRQMRLPELETRIKTGAWV